jgi:regulator of cell morphogenesis and NO signaling
MFLQSMHITKETFVSEIVRQDYRTARVFRKHGIDFCCGGKWPLGIVCESKGLEFSMLKTELENSVRTIQLSNALRFDSWTIDFLIDYIIHVHHHYLSDALPVIKDQLDNFAESHAEKYPYVQEVQAQFGYLCNETFPHLALEEEVIFPYIRQIVHAYESKESYASLLVRTLRKPVEDVMRQETETVSNVLSKIRELTNDYTPPDKACVTHRVTLSLLKELDNDMVQHLYLENQILFPKAIAMEKELLLTK